MTELQSKIQNAFVLSGSFSYFFQGMPSDLLLSAETNISNFVVTISHTVEGNSYSRNSSLHTFHSMPFSDCFLETPAQSLSTIVVPSVTDASCHQNHLYTQTLW